ncbi:MAG TPA: hypothetical protein VGE52_14330 [Pirellulales bacterium]
MPESTVPRAPALSHLRGNVSQTWLREWLTAAGEAPSDHDDASTTASLTRLSRRMPHFAFSSDDADALAAFLLRHRGEATAVPAETETPKINDEAKRQENKARAEPKKEAPPKPSAAAGWKAFLTLGCTACHTAENVGRLGPFGGGDLSWIGDKRPASWFAVWLATPEKLNADHRMPTFALASHERDSLAMYLASLKSPKAESGDPFAVEDDDAKLVARGAELWNAHRCQACHSEGQPLRERIAFPKLDAAAPGCFGAPQAAPARPGFALSPRQASAVREYLSALRGVDVLVRSPIDAGALVLEMQNCLACHARGETKGMAAQIAAVAKADSSLAADAAGLQPPALHGIGDKLHEHYLTNAVAGRQPRLRPWLSIRMPVFPLSEAEKATLAAYFTASDRIPERPKNAAPAVDDPATNRLARDAAGGRLTTADGFGCTSCHQIGSAIPHKVALNAHGTNLSQLGERIRRPWYDRWVRNPARIVPQMEMPAVKLPVHGVLKDDLDVQLAAIWEALNTPGFEPPKPNPVQVVRTSGERRPGETARVVLDAVTAGKTAFVKPVVIGLPNRHNVLFDLDHARLAGWWLGDTARQRTEGKSWYWEIGGVPRWPLATGESEFSAAANDKPQAPALAPILRGQFPTEIDWLREDAGSVSFAHRLSFESGDKTATPETWTVTQTFAPAFDAATTKGALALQGFDRTLSFEGVAAAHEVIISFAMGRPLSASSDGKTLTLESGDLVRIAESSARWEVNGDGGSAALRLVASEQDESAPRRVRLEYRSPLPPDVYPDRPLGPPAELAPAFEVAPGWQAQTLPITDAIMPTALAWRPDGALVVASLRGEVWLFRDANGDGLEDAGSPFSDKLAAPYGVAARPDGAIDVITKDALFRLTDTNGDGRAERLDNLVSGWGRTLDYHDWVVGLPSDSAGDYYVAVPCHQDKRSPEAARYHGKLLKLTPTSVGTPGERFRIEEVCGGLRFPMGLAINRNGEIFASDNQGNYNPFNELNHLVPGGRYGFINESEKGKDWPPALPPAVALPHPWTRSVNGICFLESSATGRAASKDAFGPFRGHLIGCEYDTRRLVRMSLERVGDVIQGAAYPFGETPTGDQPGLQGPVTCAIAPDDSIYIGSMRDSGWGAGTNIGSIARVTASGPLPPGIAEIRAAADGFTIHFTAPVDRERAQDAARYHVASFRRISTPAYGGNDVDRRNEPIRKLEVADDGRSVKVSLDPLRAGFVYEFQLQSLASGKAVFYPAEAYYTLLAVPESEAKR